jgi:cytochrome oxidase Cu insertion factor (SCO1/SenC/PrrC family)
MGEVEPHDVALTPEERAAALAAGAQKVPRRVVAWGFVAAAILALGGTLAERFVSAAGLNPSSGASTTTTTVGGGLSPAGALLSFEPVAPRPLPDVTLADQRGGAVSLAALRGKVVVLTFFNADCVDVCPVLAAELRRADHDLGARRREVVLLTVNTDPLALGARTPQAVTTTGLSALPNWWYLTGPLRTLNPIWRDFGISIAVYKLTHHVVHNDALYLVDPRGDVVARGSPFSDESRRGGTTLPRRLERVAGDVLASAIATRLGPHR